MIYNVHMFYMGPYMGLRIFIMVLPHSNAYGELGMSVNKKILIGNMYLTVF